MPSPDPECIEREPHIGFEVEYHMKVAVDHRVLLERRGAQVLGIFGKSNCPYRCLQRPAPNPSRESSLGGKRPSIRSRVYRLGCVKRAQGRLDFERGSDDGLLTIVHELAKPASSRDRLAVDGLRPLRTATPPQSGKGNGRPLHRGVNLTERLPSLLVLTTAETHRAKTARTSGPPSGLSIFNFRVNAKRFR